MQMLDKKKAEKLYDIVILGGGVAGLSAAITGGQLGLVVLVLEKSVFGGSVAVLESVSGYPGIERIGGWELTQTMVKQAEHVGCELIDSIDVKDVEKLENNIFVVKVSAGDSFRTKTVIISTGGQPRLLGLKNETRFAQRGIHTCAQCAGPRYKGKEVTIAGNGGWAVEAALHLLRLGCGVTFVTGDKKMVGNAHIIAKLFRLKGFYCMPGSHVERLHGGQYLEEIDVIELSTREIKRIEAAAVFVYRTIVPNSGIVAARQNAGGFLHVDENHMTSLPGVFAAGRVVHADLPIQVLVGDGSRAALAAAVWLQEDGS